jgi:hypothetical protein
MTQGPGGRVLHAVGVPLARTLLHSLPQRRQSRSGTGTGTGTGTGRRRRRRSKFVLSGPSAETNINLLRDVREFCGVPITVHGCTRVLAQYVHV